MDWSSPEILPALGALAGVMLSGIITFLVEIVRITHASRERKNALAERVFEQKREAYLDFYRWALKLRHLGEDSAVDTAEVLAASGTERSKVATITSSLDEVISRLDARIDLDKTAFMEDFRRCYSDVKFYGTSKVAETADALFVATMRHAAATIRSALIDLATKLSANAPASSSSATLPSQSSAHEATKRTLEVLSEAEAKYLGAVKKDLGIGL